MNTRKSIKRYEECSLLNVDNNSGYSTPKTYCKQSNHSFSDGCEDEISKCCEYFDDKCCSVACCTEYNESVEDFINKYVKENVIEADDANKKEKEMRSYNLQSFKETEIVNSVSVLTRARRLPTYKLQNRCRCVNKSKIHITSERLSNNGESYIAEDRKLNKSEYCRPIFNNESFVCKTVETNARLQQLVCKLMQEIQREKQRRDWKRFISLLKNKHGCRNITCSESSHMEDTRVDFKYTEDNYINIPSNYLNNLIKWQRVEVPKCNDKARSLRTESNIYESDLICYPTSAHGRSTTLKKEKENLKKLSRPIYTKVGRQKIKEDIVKYRLTNKSSNNKNMVYIKNTLASQTEPNALLPLKEKNNAISRTQQTLIEEFANISNKLRSEEENTQEIENNNADPLANIETKMDTLQNSINLLIEEIKRKEYKKVEKYSSIPNEVENINVNNIKSDSFDIARKCNLDIDTNRSQSSVCPRPIPQTDFKIVKSNKMLMENIVYNASEKEINAGNKIIIEGNSFFSSPFQKPTSEKATEITASFHKSKVKASKIIITEENTSTTDQQRIEKMTKAANTEPLSVLALLRVSTETVRQLLSYMPTIDYYSYLSMLQFPYPNGRKETKYVCNICGASFDKASLLNDHIKAHDIGVTRDCCVCQHVLEAQSHRHPDLFKCQYCGQRFTRAYCCELHQQSCAKRLGLRYDVPSSLILLR